jgi:hypothetical protein
VIALVVYLLVAFTLNSTCPVLRPLSRSSKPLLHLPFTDSGRTETHILILSRRSRILSPPSRRRRPRLALHYPPALRPPIQPARYLPPLILSPLLVHLRLQKLKPTRKERALSALERPLRLSPPTDEEAEIGSDSFQHLPHLVKHCTQSAPTQGPRTL